MSGYDAVMALLPMLRALVVARGDPSALAFRPELLGGVALRDTLGPQPLLLVPAALGASATSVLNFATFATQTLFAFFGQRTLGDLSVLLGRGRPRPAYLVGSGLVFLAFAPFVGWRAGYGHLTLLVGLLPFLAALALVAASAVASLNRFLVAAATLTVAVSLPFAGQQIVLYGAVFGLPLLAAVHVAGGRAPRFLAVPVLAALSGLLLAAPGLWPMLEHAWSSDALRELGGETVTYSYLTAGPLDWLTSLLWLAPEAGARKAIHLHESNVPFGPILLLLALVPRKGRPLLVGLAVSAGLAVALASNLRPLSDLLLALVPPLRSFRVPTRALFPALAVLPLLALASLPTEASAARGRLLLRSLLVGLGLAMALFFAPPPLREILAWGLAVATLVTMRGVPTRVAWLLPLIMGLAGGSLGAFRQRLLPFPDAESRLAEARALGDAVKRHAPRLAAPLARVTLPVETQLLEATPSAARGIGANLAFAAGLASLDGYAFPQRRFVALVRALRGEPYSPNALLLRFREEYPPSRVLFQLYNVGHALTGTEGVATVPPVRERGPTAGAAWFPATVVVDPDLQAMAAALLAWGDATHARARRELRVVRSDPALQGLPTSLAPACGEAIVHGAYGASGGLAIRVQTYAPCLLVVALNYAESLEAVSASRRLRTFPAYGALLGIEVPPEATRIEIRARPWPGAGTLGVAVAGLALLGLAVRKGG